MDSSGTSKRVMVIDFPNWEPSEGERALFEEWRGNTIQHLVNHKNGVMPHRLPGQLMERFDERIPLHNMGSGIRTIKEFLYQMGTDIEVRRFEGRLYIFVRESAVPKHLRHIRDMVLGQRDDRDGVLRRDGQYASCNELLRYEYRLPLQPSGVNRMAANIASSVRSLMSTDLTKAYNFAGTNYKYGREGSQSSSLMRTPRELASTTAATSTGSSAFKMSMANMVDNEWGNYTPPPNMGFKPSEIVYSKPAPSKVSLPKSAIVATEDDCAGLNEYASSYLRTIKDKEYDPFPISTRSTAVTTNEQQTATMTSSTQAVSLNLEDILAEARAVDKAIGELRTGTGEAIKATETRGPSPVAARIKTPEIRYGYSIDTNMGLSYPYNTVIMSMSTPSSPPSGKTSIRVCSHKPKIEFPPYLPAGCNSFKSFLQQTGQLEKFWTTIMTPEM